jgi:hypothetical protein
VLASSGYPGNKSKFCNCCGISIAASDQPTLNSGWANATWEQKQEIVEAHKYFELGTLYYFSHDVTGPHAEETKQRFNRYGLCADEFVDNGHMPYQVSAACWAAPPMRCDICSRVTVRCQPW